MDIPFLARKFYNSYFPEFAKNATRIGTVSSFSQKDIAQSFKIPVEKIDVLYNGANELYKPLTNSEKERTKRKYSKRSDFFLYVGSLHPRKNIVRLLKAFDEFKKTISCNQKLILVGESLFKTGKIEETFKKLIFKEDVIFTGRLPNEELKLLLGSAMALTFVPYFEGFGIPIVEAMYCDTPVITSNVTSMPEVAGDAALFVDPYSIDSIKEAMIKIFMEPLLRIDLIEKSQIQREKFTWHKTADKLWKSIEKCF